MSVGMQSNKGFTLLELLIVVAMIGVVSAIAFPNLLKQLPKWRTDSVVRELSGKLMQARLRAIQSNKKHGVKFSFGNIDTFKIQIEGDDDIWSDLGYEGQSGSSVNISIKGSCPGDRAEFYTNGTAASCSIRIRSSDNARDGRIKINSSTGNVDVCKVNCGAW